PPPFVPVSTCPLGGRLITKGGPGHKPEGRGANERPSDFGRRALAVEARGFEPRSRGTSASASTCVACLFSAGRSLTASPTPFALRPPASRVPVGLTGREV